MGIPAGLSSCPKAKTTQECLRRNLPTFISAKDWPSWSPDLNPRDYKLWAILEDMACQKRHNDLSSLKRSLVEAAAEIPLETVRAAIGWVGIDLLFFLVSALLEVNDQLHAQSDLPPLSKP